MVIGIEKFRENFAGHEAEYALIGGAACDLIFDEAGLDFRATKDFDIVLSVEVVSSEFEKAFKDFINAGGYENRQLSAGRKQYYRFDKPKDKSYPYMIEIFSRQPDGIELPKDFNITKVSVDEGILSLSAILLCSMTCLLCHFSKTQSVRNIREKVVEHFRSFLQPSHDHALLQTGRAGDLHQ